MTTSPRSEAHRRWNRPMILLKALLAGAALVLVPHAALADDEAAHSKRFQQALYDYERSHWGAAFNALSTLADEGHAPSARMALLMARFGPRLYATRFDAAEARKQRWLVVAAADAAPAAAPVPAALAAAPDGGRR